MSSKTEVQPRAHDLGRSGLQHGRDAGAEENTDEGRGVEFGPSDFVRYAQSCGAKGIAVKRLMVSRERCARRWTFKDRSSSRLLSAIPHNHLLIT